MADTLEVGLDEMADIAAGYKEEITISNQCVIFAETEVISLINAEKEVADILFALHQSLGNRISALARGLIIEEQVVMTGGVAKNQGVCHAVANGLGVPVNHLDGIDPQINGALGAALIAKDRAVSP